MKRRDGMNRRDFLKGVAAGAIVGAMSEQLGEVPAAPPPQPSKIPSYNPNMEYRRLGKTGLWVSAVCLGGHWKGVNRIEHGAYEGENWLAVDLNHKGFRKNRFEVIDRCLEVGINYVDACTWKEVIIYAEALKGRREAMYFGFSWYEEEMRNPNFRTKEALLRTLEKGLKEAKLDYVDLWRITMHEQSSRHTEQEVEEMMKALAKAKEQGKARFAGFSSHDRPHIHWMLDKYNDVIDVIVTPFTAKSREKPTDSMFDAVRKYDIGVFGIKPFADASIFRGDGTPNNPHAKEDDEIARLAIRNILATEAITAPIPGLMDARQVDNMVLSVREFREQQALNPEEKAKLDEATRRMSANLPPNYHWLKDWEWV